MLISDIPTVSLELFKRNHSDYASLSDEEVVAYFDHVYDIKKAPKLTDEDKAVSLIQEVISRGGFILGATDYDSDGLNSAAVITKALNGKSDNYKVIHNKRVHGNGFNKVFVAKIKRIHDKKPIDLIITADHGSASNDAFKELKAYGVKHIIITDHHDIPEDNYPDSVDVFINPQKQAGDPVGMCGCYVVFKILSGLYTGDEDIYNALYKPCLPHVAIATVSDVMSLNIPYNRLVVRAGLQIMNNDTGLWCVIKEMLNIPMIYSYKDIGFVVAPFINTGNRTSEEELFNRILIEPDMVRLRDLIKLGIGLNMDRKSVRKDIMTNLLQSLVVSDTDKAISVIVDTPMAINGIIASSLGEQYQVPVTCFILDKENSTLSGSARGILDHVNISKVFKDMHDLDKDLFIGCGGHKGAGGCSIHMDKFDLFRELFNKVVSEVPVPEVVKTTDQVIDISTSTVSLGLIEDINFNGPYGKDWEMPKFRGSFKIKTIFAMKALAILTLITADGRTMKATYFYSNDDSKDSIEEELPRGTIITAVFEPQYYKRYNKVSFTLILDSVVAR